MSDGGVLEGLRIGCVRYLNSKPLIYGLEGVRLEHPSRLAQELRDGELDVALVPVFELLRAPGEYIAVDGVGVTSDGPVYSVFVAHREPIEVVESILVDPASLTSVHLLQVLFKGVIGRKAPLVEMKEEGRRGDMARLLIGNQAIAFRNGEGKEGWNYWDLGAVWKAWTGLPFVYALWVMRKGLRDPIAIAREFQRIARVGESRIDEIAQEDEEVAASVAREYLRDFIGFAVGGREHLGLIRFREELLSAGFLGDGEKVIEFVS
ncbi:MAG: menaquinone biosynthesis protein [Verrucomicrobiota bacterium]